MQVAHRTRGPNQVYLFKDARVVALHLGLETGGGFEVGELGGVSADVTGDLAAGRSGAHTGKISLSVRQTLQRNTDLLLDLLVHVTH